MISSKKVWVLTKSRNRRAKLGSAGLTSLRKKGGGRSLVKKNGPSLKERPAQKKKLSKDNARS